jgi:hypothetical protein
MHPSRDGTFAFEFAFNEILVIEAVVRQIEPFNVGRLRPAGLFIRAAFRTGPGIAWHFRAAIGAYFRRHRASFHPRIFLVRFQVQPHQDVIVSDSLHVFHVFGQTNQVAKTQHGEHFHGGFLLADKLGLHFFEP